MISATSLPKLWLGTTNPAAIAGQSNNNTESDYDKDCERNYVHPNGLDVDREQINSLIQRIYEGDIKQIRLCKDIFLDHIEDYTVALSAKGAHIVVLDGSASRLFSHLGDTSSVQMLRRMLSWAGEVFEQVIALLLVEGVLSSPQTATPGIRQDGPTRLTAWLHLANGCNLSCQYCYLSFNGRQMEVSTAEQAVDAVYRSAAIHGYTGVKLKYAGGEPTLNFKCLLAAQQKAEELSARTNISLDAVMLTNGVRISDDQIDKLVSHNIRVMMSLDGMGEFHDVQRPLAGKGKGSFEHVFQTLDRLSDRGISPHISVTITNKNIRGLPILVDHLLDRKLRFSLNLARKSIVDLPIYREVSSESGELIAGLRSVYCLLKRRLPPYSILSNLSDLADLRTPHSHTCGVGKDYLVINYDGNIAKCQMEMAAPVTTIKVNDPLALIQLDTTGIQNLSVDEKDCRDCVWRYRCAGGCPWLSFQHKGQYDARSPVCEIYEAILPEVVRLEALRLIRFEMPWDFRPPLH